MASSVLFSPFHDVIISIRAIEGVRKLLDEKPELETEITNKVSQLKSENPIQLLVTIKNNKSTSKTKNDTHKSIRFKCECAIPIKSRIYQRICR